MFAAIDRGGQLRCRLFQSESSDISLPSPQWHDPCPISSLTLRWLLVMTRTFTNNNRGLRDRSRWFGGEVGFLNRAHSSSGLSCVLDIEKFSGRSEDRREGKECVSTGRSRWWRDH